MTIDFDRLARSWIKLQYAGVDSVEAESFDWTISVLVDLLNDDPEQLWVILDKILEIDGSDFIAGRVGAGYLEDLLLRHCDDFESRVIEKATMSKPFRVALSNVWIDEGEISNSNIFSLIENCKP